MVVSYRLFVKCVCCKAPENRHHGRVYNLSGVEDSALRDCYTRLVTRHVTGTSQVRAMCDGSDAEGDLCGGFNSSWRDMRPDTFRP